MTESLHIVLILGSLRVGSNTAKAVELVADEFKRDAGITLDIIDPRQLPLVFPGMAGQELAVAALASDLQQRVRRADGIVLVTPEYDGSYSAVLKLIIEHLGYPSVLMGKPVGLLGVASGRVGAQRALEHLRSLCLHIGAIVLPQPRSVATIHRAFDAQGRCIDAQAEAVFRATANQLKGFLQGSAGKDAGHNS